MATSKRLFRGARVSTTRIAPIARGLHVTPVTGTVVTKDTTLDNEFGKISCKCGCGGYWNVRWDTLKAPHDVMSFLAHDLELLDIVDQLASWVKSD